MLTSFLSAYLELTAGLCHIAWRRYGSTDMMTALSQSNKYGAGIALLDERLPNVRVLTYLSYLGRPSFCYLNSFDGNQKHVRERHTEWSRCWLKAETE